MDDVNALPKIILDAARIPGMIHARNIVSKFKNKKTLRENKEILKELSKPYEVYIEDNFNLKGFSEEVIAKRVSLLNGYYDAFEPFQHAFSSQSKFRSTILEEFMALLFMDFLETFKVEIKDSFNRLKLGAAKAYSNLYFKPENITDFVSDVKIGVNTKNQDFSIYRAVNITAEGKKLRLNLPTASIEVKTYIDKTMLDGIIATAEKVKSGNPYCRFVAVCETYDVSYEEDPAYSLINQIYVLRKSKRKEGEIKPIQADVVIDLFNETVSHLKNRWSAVETRLTTTGKII